MLTLPLLFAVASAGAVGGVHCAGMCGGVARLLTRPAQNEQNEHKAIMLKQVGQHASLRHSLLLHAGRLSLYALLGGVVGGVGAGGMWLLPMPEVQKIMFIIGNLALILLGLRLLHIPVPAFFYVWRSQLSSHLGNQFGSINPLTHLLTQIRSHAQGVLAQGKKQPFVLGMAWGCLPCGLLFAVLPFALLSSSVFGGAILMLVFGLTSLPHLLLVQTASNWGQRWHVLFAVLLLGLGGFGLWHFDMQQMPGFLCVTAQP